MSRNRKCRVWYPNVKKMVYFEQPVIAMDADGKWKMMQAPTGETVYMGKNIVLDFTGLKDRVDEEAYEGDIITLYDRYTGEKLSTHEIVWGGEQYPAYHLKPGLETQENDFSYLACSPNAPKWLVRGNSYENPELLEKEGVKDGKE